jgi:simple sugar transport system ATP-binding protein
MPAPRLALRDITKSYGGVAANDAISLEVAQGEIHAVLGENGAGKSTLMKIVAGVVQADAGTILWNGAPVQIPTPAAARRLGIGMVHQHFSLFESISVTENIAVALDGKFDLARTRRQIIETASRYGLPVDPDRLLHHLSVGERQRVEILRALLQTPQLLILDEPTSVLTPQAVESLFAVLRRVADEGCAILYISHKLDEIRALCHRATVLRGGRVVSTVDPTEQNAAELAHMMVGTAVPPIRHDAPVGAGDRTQILELAGLSTRADDPFGTDLRDIALTLHEGEILGIAGISGNGQSELLSILSGERVLPDGEMIRLDGKPIADRGAAARRRLGLGFIPEERLGRGAVPTMSLAENCLLTRGDSVKHGLIDRSILRDQTTAIIQRFDVRCGGPASPARSLSGGNLQKFIVGREIALAPKLLIVAQPSWGVDIAAARFIRQTLIDLSRAGTAILVISEELDELFEIADRLMVLYQGRLSPVRERHQIGLMMAGA